MSIHLIYIKICHAIFVFCIYCQQNIYLLLRFAFTISPFNEAYSDEVFPICFRYIYEPWKRNFALVGIHKYVQQVIFKRSEQLLILFMKILFMLTYHTYTTSKRRFSKIYLTL